MQKHLQRSLLPLSFHSTAFQGLEFGPDVTVIGPTNITLDREISSGSLLFSVNPDGLYERSEEVVMFRIVGVTGAQIDPERDLLTVTILDGDRTYKSHLNLPSIHQMKFVMYYHYKYGVMSCYGRSPPPQAFAAFGGQITTAIT